MNLSEKIEKEEKIYPVVFEIAGDFAMFANPHTSPNFISYPLPPQSACDGIMKAILLQKSINLKTTSVKICAPISYADFAYNYSLKTFQRFEKILTNVRYIISAIPVYVGNGEKGINNRHCYQERFYKHLRKGKHHRRLCLGRSEFLPSYCGPVRPETKPIDVNFSIGFFPFMEFDRKGNLVKDFKTLEVKSGEAVYNA